MTLLRLVAVGALLFDAVLYAMLFGFWPSLAWLSAAVATARFLPPE